MSDVNKGALGVLAGWGISLLALALAYKQFNSPEWLKYLGMGDVILWLVGTFLFGQIFDISLLPALSVSAFFVGLITVFVDFIVGLVFIVISIVLILITAFVNASGGA